MKRIAALVLLACLAANAYAIDTFVASDIRIDGLQRIAAGTVFTYLPVEKGDRITSERVQQAIRALYKTGFFTDVQITRQGDILVISVKERPAISKIQLKGNKDLKSEDLLKGLKDIGLAEGEPFDRLSLDRVTQELTRQYYNRGKYNVTIKPKVIELDRNRVEISIIVAEGKVAKIKQINLVGNHAFSENDIRSDFESDTTNWTSWYSKDDQYSREKLSGDLEKLNSYYLDRGYVDFNIESTQVSISPDKRMMYLTANVTEGEIYKISEIKLSGNLVLAEADMAKLIRAKPGEEFSRKKLEQTAQAMTSVLANIGYAFAQVTPIPTLDREKRLVGINFFVNPGKRVYVRHITFKGNHSTQDEVMRREMRQLEGAWYSQAAIDRSKVRLQRLGYFKKVEIETPKVPGSEDQVDLNVAVEETSSGAFTFGLGFSQVYGIVLSISVSQNNFLGTGDRAAFTASKSDFLTKYELSYYQPYLTQDGIGLGYDVSYSKLNQQQANLANYLSNTAAFSTYLGIPVTESDTVNVQLGVSKTQIFTGVTVQQVDPVTGLPILDANGDPIFTTSYYSPQPIVDYIKALNHNTFHTWSVQASWAHDTRNRYFNPTHGSLQQFSAEFALPGSTVEYYKLIYKYAQYIPVTSALTFEGSATIGYGNTYRAANGINPETGAPLKVSGLPFFENFYAGGVSDVRSFRDNTLGPFTKSPTCLTPFDAQFCRQPLGGNLKVVGSAELIFPTPFVKDDDTTTRLSWYVDAGNVFNQNNNSLSILSPNNLYGNDSISWSDMRVSTGISLHWQAPVGPIIINIGRPVVKKPGDIAETLQFNFGQTF